MELSDVMRMTNSELCEWIRQPRHVGVADLDWFGLAEATRALALGKEDDAQRRCAWAQVSLWAARLAVEARPDLKTTLVPSEVLLRSELIRTLGPADGVRSLRDLWSVVESALAAQDARDLVAGGAVQLSKTDSSDLLRLRRIKNILRSVEPLLSGANVQAPAEVSWWLARWGILP